MEERLEILKNHTYKPENVYIGGDISQSKNNIGDCTDPKEEEIKAIRTDEVLDDQAQSSLKNSIVNSTL